MVLGHLLRSSAYTQYADMHSFIGLCSKFKFGYIKRKKIE